MNPNHIWIIARCVQFSVHLFYFFHTCKCDHLTWASVIKGVTACNGDASLNCRLYNLTMFLSLFLKPVISHPQKEHSSS